MTPAEEARIFRALADLTGLPLDPEGVAFLHSKAQRTPFETGNGTLMAEWNRTVCRVLFGFDAYEGWLTGKRPKPHELETPKLKLENYFQQKIPGTLIHYGDVVESGEEIRLEVQVDWPRGAPNPAIYQCPPMVTPSKFGTVALLHCTWRFERVPSGAGAPPTPPTPNGSTAGSAQVATPHAPGAPESSERPAQSKLAPASANPISLADAAAPEMLPPAALSPAATSSTLPPASATAASTSSAQTTEVGEMLHQFALAPDEASAVFRVTCDARFDEYFAPATFTRDIVVLSSAAAMSSMRTAAFAGLGASDDARRGDAWTADAAPELRRPQKPGEPSADERSAAGRATQREQLIAVRAYLADKPASKDAVAAIDRELARQAETEKLLAEDRTRGWQPFQIRGTYLSRTEGLASGPLDLHGTVHVVQHYDSYAGDGPSTTQLVRHDQYVVQIRDLSRRFDQQDSMFEGTGDSFDAALKKAFDDLALAYPKGVVAIEAEQFASAAGAASGAAVVGGRTGKVLGFQRSTETTWKKVKEKVWDPVASFAANMGAIALMALFPESIPIVAPAIIAYNTAPTLDRVASENARGTLTLGKFTTAAGEVALNLLPLVGRAKPFTAGWFAIETANWGGQTALMTATAVDIAHELQTQQVVALGAEYEAFLQLRQRSLPSDPHLATAEAAIRDRAVKVSDAITDQIWTQIRDNGIVMVTGSLVHNAGEQVRTAIDQMTRPAPQGTARAVALAGSDVPSTGGTLPAADAPTASDTAARPHREPDTAHAETPTPRNEHATSAVAIPEDRTPVILSGDDVAIRQLARNVPSVPGYVDVVVHGSTDSFTVLRADRDISIDQRAFATYLRKNGLEGQNIRLISCETGRHPKGIAQHLANQLHVEVLAPSDVAWVHPDGSITIGQRNRNTGNWVVHKPKVSEARSKPASLLEAEQRPFRPEEEFDDQPPQHVAPAHHDHRARASQASAAELSRLLGATVVFDAQLSNGIEVQVHRVNKLFGFDLEVQEVRIGGNALLADVMTHAATIKNVERYNGIVGRLRQLAERLAVWTGKRPAAQYAHGSRAWKTNEELTKLSALLTQRHAEFGQGNVDPNTLREEIAFLSGRYAYHEEVLRSLEDFGKGADPDFTIAAPDVGRITNEAIANGYKLPGADQGVHPDWYYYRHKRSNPDEFELALKPSAPYDAPSIQARTISGRFVDFEKPNRPQSAEIPYDMPQAEAVQQLRKTVGFERYALMIENAGLATRDVVDGVVRHVRSQRMTSGEPVTTDYLPCREGILPAAAHGTLARPETLGYCQPAAATRDDRRPSRQRPRRSCRRLVPRPAYPRRRPSRERWGRAHDGCQRRQHRVTCYRRRRWQYSGGSQRRHRQNRRRSARRLSRHARPEAKDGRKRQNAAGDQEGEICFHQD